MKKGTLSLAIIVSLQLSCMSYAAVPSVLIDNLTPRTGFLRTFGEPNTAYYAQTFIAPSDDPLGKITIEIKPRGHANPVQFRLLLTETTSPSSEFHPTNVLFESDTQSLPIIFDVQQITIGLEGTQLLEGERYAFVLDAFSDRDGIVSQAEVGINDNYVGGEVYFLNFESKFTDHREDHFAESWSKREIDFTFRLVSVPEPTTLALVDIKPGSSPNSVNLKSKGVLSVAILSTADFNVNDVDIDTLLFGDPLLIDNGGTAVSPLRNAYRDVSGDGLLDLTLKFSTADLVEHGALGRDTLDGILIGLLLDSTPFEGMDSIRIVPPNKSNRNIHQVENGDLDNDEDGADFLKWQRGESPNPFSASDLADWEANYGTVATLSAATAAVPEPTTCTLALAALCLAMGRRRSH